MAQGRELDSDDVEAVKEVFAESAGGDALAQVPVRRGEDANVDLRAPCRADRANRPALEHVQSSLACSARRHLADLVEEQRAAVGFEEEALPSRSSRR